MFLAISKFKVKNGIENQVCEAFINRPHLVDSIDGFIDMEVYSPAEDNTEFWLLTRWLSQEQFLSWHNSDAHKQSHQGIPKGLKLDPTATQVWHLNKIAD